jgi:hypothetical protein
MEYELLLLQLARHRGLFQVISLNHKEGIEGERFRTSQVRKVGGYIAELGYTPSFLTPPCPDLEIWSHRFIPPGGVIQLMRYLNDSNAIFKGLIAGVFGPITNGQRIAKVACHPAKLRLWLVQWYCHVQRPKLYAAGFSA